MMTSLLTQVQAQVTKIMSSYIVETESGYNSSAPPPPPPPPRRGAMRGTAVFTG